MKYKEALSTIVLIIISLAGIILLYLAIEQITEFLSESGYIGLSIISNASLAVMIYFLVRWFNKKINHLPANNFGFGLQGVVKNSFTGILVSALIVFLILLSAFFYANNNIVFIGLKKGHAITLIEFLMANLVVAAWEEIYFRGLVFNTLLKKNFGFQRAAALSSGLFTVTHFASYDLSTITPLWFVEVFFLSTILLYLYVFTQSIWASIGFHFFWDSAFMSLDENENSFGIIQMKTYVGDTMLIDHISILIIGIILVLFFILRRKKMKLSEQLYLSRLSTNLN